MALYKTKPSGFTIVELLIVIIVIGILTTIGIVSYKGIRQNAIITSLKSDLSNAADILRTDQVHSGDDTFPDPLTAANNGDGVPASGDTTYQYVVSNTAASKTFCLTAIRSNVSYFITQEGTPLPGPCPILYLDAGIATSYPGTGTNWYDLSGNGNNAVLTGGVGFDSADGGSLVFEGISGYGTISNNSTLDFSSEQTVLIVMKHSFIAGRRNPWDQAYGGYGTWTHESGNSINQYIGNAGANNSPYIGIGSPATPRDVWNFMCSTRDVSNQKWYINGAYSSTRANPYGVLAYTAADIRIGRGYAGYWEGNMSIVMAYDTALSESQVKQIFEALRGRFGV